MGGHYLLHGEVPRESTKAKFPDALDGKRVVCLHIPDDYEFMQPDLLDELRAKLVHHVTLPEDGRTV